MRWAKHVAGMGIERLVQAFGWNNLEIETNGETQT